MSSDPVEQALAEATEVIESYKTPYPWCRGNPTKADCAAVGTCRRDPNCGE